MTISPKPARLKNYTAGISVEESVGIIHRALAQHKARRISFENDENGEPVGLTFEMALTGQQCTFRMPCHLLGVRALVKAAYLSSSGGISDERLEAQTLRTAWANLKDWVLAQMALIDAGMVKTEEVFFPYLLENNGRTVFEAFEEQLALPSPKPATNRRVSVEEVR